jgi:phenylacetate-CoA ligase
MCSCGQPFSTLREIRGRMIDYFPLPSGCLLHPYEIVVPMQEKAKWIRQTSSFKSRSTRFACAFAPFRIPSTEELADFESAIRALLEPGVRFRVSIVSELAAEVTGKFRLSRSLVRSAYDEVASQQL